MFFFQAEDGIRDIGVTGVQTCALPICGVSLDLCERVTGHLASVREKYALEVSSPGVERPLSKPEHFRRFVGRRARVRTRGEHDGRRSFTGELLGATDDEVTVAADTGVVSIAYADIHRSNLLGD